MRHARGVLLAGLAGVLIGAGWTSLESDGISDVPDEVRRALEALAGGHELSELEREVKDGFVVYEAEWMADGREHEVTLTEHGELVESEDEVPADDVPAAVRKAARERLGPGPIEYERNVVVVYEAEVRGQADARFRPTGAAMPDHAEDHDGDGDDHDGDDADGDDGDDDDDGEQAIPLDRVPAEIIRAAEAAVPGIQLTSAELEMEDGTAVFELHGLLDGEEWEIEIAPDGTVLEVERDDD